MFELWFYRFVVLVGTLIIMSAIYIVDPYMLLFGVLTFLIGAYFEYLERQRE